ncbi:MAG: helix-turn-helix domain-containing protein [Tissierella sp.]|uniref:helix-turn-helix domain-containing protein n=1 Tax=Tissierella sp. TaxID=41274 RepID=UPI003F9AB8AF
MLPHRATYLNVNKCYFCSLFKKETGKTFTQFLNELRVKKSMDLLKEGNLSMLDIALDVGFNNQNYYNITFKKITNKTPSEYKNSLLNP